MQRAVADGNRNGIWVIMAAEGTISCKKQFLPLRGLGGNVRQDAERR